MPPAGGRARHQGGQFLVQQLALLAEIDQRVNGREEEQEEVLQKIIDHLLPATVHIRRRLIAHRWFLHAALCNRRSAQALIRRLPL